MTVSVPTVFAATWRVTMMRCSGCESKECVVECNTQDCPAYCPACRGHGTNVHECSEGPITLEGLLEFLSAEDDMAEDHPEEVNVEEVLRRMREARA